MDYGYYGKIYPNNPYYPYQPQPPQPYHGVQYYQPAESPYYDDKYNDYPDNQYFNQSYQGSGYSQDYPYDQGCQGDQCDNHAYASPQHESMFEENLLQFMDEQKRKMSEIKSEISMLTSVILRKEEEECITQTDEQSVGQVLPSDTYAAPGPVMVRTITALVEVPKANEKAIEVQDLGSMRVPCRVKDPMVEQAVHNLGAAFNWGLFLIEEKLGSGNLKLRKAKSLKVAKLVEATMKVKVKRWFDKRKVGLRYGEEAAIST